MVQAGWCLKVRGIHQGRREHEEANASLGRALNSLARLWATEPPPLSDAEHHLLASAIFQAWLASKLLPIAARDQESLRSSLGIRGISSAPMTPVAWQRAHTM